MRLTTITILACCITLAPAARGQEKGTQIPDRPGAGQTGAPAFSPEFRAEFVKLQAEADKLSEGANRAYQAAKSDAEREAVIQQMLQIEVKDGAVLASRAIELVKSNPRDLAVGDVLTWILEKFPGSASATQAAELLAKNHIKSRRSQFIASQFAPLPMSWTVKLLRAFVQADLPEPQKTQAYLDLGLALKTQVGMKSLIARADARKLSVMEMRFGKEYLEWIRNADASKLKDEAIQNFNTVIQRERGKVASPPRDRAEAAIKEVRSLR